MLLADDSGRGSRAWRRGCGRCADRRRRADRIPGGLQRRGRDHRGRAERGHPGRDHPARPAAAVHRPSPADDPAPGRRAPPGRDRPAARVHRMRPVDPGAAPAHRPVPADRRVHRRRPGHRTRCLRPHLLPAQRRHRPAQHRHRRDPHAGTPPRSSMRSAPTPRRRWASSTPCRSRGVPASSTRNHFRTWASSTAGTSSWPRPPPPRGGLDSLLDPHGTIRQAMDKAATTWYAEQTYFVTNGTSTANKIVVQSLTQPGRHRADRPQLPQVAPLRTGAGRRKPAVPGRLPAGRLRHVRRRPAARDQAGAAGPGSGGPAGPGTDGAADQLHLRRHRLQPAAR